ncbi:MAG: TIGR00180 family glycosyltransferase [Candidatus Omnitrophota bacterium]
MIIPTYNRPVHLKRLLAYYHQANMQNRFLVLDSSHEAIRNGNKALVASCGESYRHIVFPSSMPVATKLFEGLSLVQTHYGAICADDDVIFHDALRKALAFLSTHPDYVCADGIYLNFRPSNNEIHFQIEYGSHGIDANHPGARVFRLFQRYESMFYAVYRASNLRDIFSFVKNIPTLHYQELFQTTAAMLKGKSHRLSEFYAARQACGPADPIRDKWQTFYWFADNSAEFLSHYKAYRDDLWGFYQKFCTGQEMDQKVFFLAMDTAHAVFFSTGCPPKYFYSRLQQHWPEDVLAIINDSDNALEALKSNFMRKTDEVLNVVAWQLRKRGFLNSYNPPRTVERLRGEVAAKGIDGKRWGCRLPQNLLWLAAKPRFRAAFSELCNYLDDAKEKPNPHDQA